MALRKAERRKAKIRVGLFGPSGSGKTFSALIMARGMASSWDKIAIIDTEHGSADLYCHLGDYNVLPLEAPFTPEKYIDAIQECEKAGMEVVIIDSISHEWDGKGGLLESNELLAQTKFRGNTWSAWSVTTPRHQKFLDAITNSKCHVIACGRSKTETIQTEDKKIKKVGMKEITRDGFEYEMTIGFSLDRDGHYAAATKDRTGIFIDRDPFRITEETGQAIMEWCESGDDAPAATQKPAQAPAAPKPSPAPSAPLPAAPAAPKPTAKQLEEIETLMRELEISDDAKNKTRKMLTTAADAEAILTRLQAKHAELLEAMKAEAETAEVVDEQPPVPEDPESAELRAIREEVKGLITPSIDKSPLVQLEEAFAAFCGSGTKPETATLIQWQTVRKLLQSRRKEQEKETAPAG